MKQVPTSSPHSGADVASGPYVYTLIGADEASGLVHTLGQMRQVPMFSPHTGADEASPYV